MNTSILTAIQGRVSRHPVAAVHNKARPSTAPTGNSGRDNPSIQTTVAMTAIEVASNSSLNRNKVLIISLGLDWTIRIIDVFGRKRVR